MEQHRALGIGNPQATVGDPIRSAVARTSTVSAAPRRYSTAFRLDEPTLMVNRRASAGWPSRRVLPRSLSRGWYRKVPSVLRAPSRVLAPGNTCDRVLQTVRGACLIWRAEKMNS